jgi:hypothetical protein
MKEREWTMRKLTSSGTSSAARLRWLAATGLVLVLSACGNGDPNSLAGTSGGSSGSANGGSDPGSPGAGGAPQGQQGNGSDPNANSNPNIDQRQINYGEALRTASLKLVGDLPTLTEIQSVTDAASYAAKIDSYLADPRFTVRQIQWWRDTLKTGQPGMSTKNGAPSYDTAATFAAEIVANDRPFTDLFTASTNTCPTFSNGTFTDASCTNGVTTAAGVLTDPGLMSQYYANMAFRRVRFVQETFVCSKFPAEFSSSPQIMGSGAYTSPWPFTSITGGSQAKINFQDTSAVICANCHTTENHMAPLFAHFDDMGQYDATKFQVQVPSPGNPTATLADWLPSGEQFYWRQGGPPVTDIPGLGAQIAADPAVTQCMVTREWNYAMSRGDVVDDTAPVPNVLTDPLVQDFKQNGLKIKHLLKAIFTSDDFVKF